MKHRSLTEVPCWDAWKTAQEERQARRVTDYSRLAQKAAAGLRWRKSELLAMIKRDYCVGGPAAEAIIQDAVNRGVIALVWGYYRHPASLERGRALVLQQLQAGPRGIWELDAEPWITKRELPRLLKIWRAGDLVRYLPGLHSWALGERAPLIEAKE